MKEGETGNKKGPGKKSVIFFQNFYILSFYSIR